MKNISMLDCQITTLSGPTTRIVTDNYSEKVVVVLYEDLQKLEKDFFNALNALVPFAEVGANFSDPASCRLKMSENAVWGYNDDMVTYGDFRAAYGIFYPEEVKESEKIAADPEYAEYIRLKAKFGE